MTPSAAAPTDAGQREPTALAITAASRSCCISPPRGPLSGFRLYPLDSAKSRKFRSRILSFNSGRSGLMGRREFVPPSRRRTGAGGPWRPRESIERVAGRAPRAGMTSPPPFRRDRPSDATAPSAQKSGAARKLAAPLGLLTERRNLGPASRPDEFSIAYWAPRTSCPSYPITLSFPMVSLEPNSLLTSPPDPAPNSAKAGFNALTPFLCSGKFVPS